MNDLRQALLTGEEITFETRKHWIAPLRDSLVAILLIVGALVLWWLSPDGAGLFGSVGGLMDLAGWGLIIVGIAWIIGNIVGWLSAHFGVSNMRVLRYEGIIRKQASETLLSSVTDVKLTTPALGGVLGYGDLTILTASGAEGRDDFTSIRRAAEMRTALQNAKGVLATVAGPVAAVPPAPALPAPAPGAAAAPIQPAAPAGAPVAARTDDPAAALERLADLHARGIITDAEFEAKKAELLGRI